MQKLSSEALLHQRIVRTEQIEFAEQRIQRRGKMEEMVGKIIIFLGAEPSKELIAQILEGAPNVDKIKENINKLHKDLGNDDEIKNTVKNILKTVEIEISEQRLTDLSKELYDEPEKAIKNIVKEASKKKFGIKN